MVCHEHRKTKTKTKQNKPQKQKEEGMLMGVKGKENRVSESKPYMYNLHMKNCKKIIHSMKDHLSHKLYKLHHTKIYRAYVKTRMP